MEDFEKAIKAHNLKRQAGIINQFSDDLEKAGTPRKAPGPKSYPIGTVRNGRKKMAEGKWVPVKGEKKSKPAEKPKSKYSKEEFKAAVKSGEVTVERSDLHEWQDEIPPSVKMYAQHNGEYKLGKVDWNNTSSTDEMTIKFADGSSQQYDGFSKVVYRVKKTKVEGAKKKSSNKEITSRPLSEEEIGAIYDNFIDTNKYKETVIDDPDGTKENAILKIDTPDGKSYKVLTSAEDDEKWWKWEGAKKKSSNKVADPLSGKSGAELSSEQKARILSSHSGDTKRQTEKYLSDPKYVFSMRTSQFGNERLYIVNKETGKPSFIGAGTVPSSGPAMGIPSTGFESKFAMEKVMSKEK